MKINTKVVVLLTVYTIAGITSQLYAQDQEEVQGLEEVIVTAQKREQSLQDVPMAVSTVTETQMKDTGIFRPGDLAMIVPNLNVTAPHVAAAPNFSMRGISVANEYSYNQASPIGIYVNEIYMGARFTHGANLYDLERVEVLRGPQGTLYGRNTTGGAINFITRGPSMGDSVSGYVIAGIGNRSRAMFEGAVDATLAENFGMRLAAKYSRVDDYMKNLDPGGDDGHGGDGGSGRITLRYAGEKADVVFRGYVSREDAGGTGVIAVGSGPDDRNIYTGYCRCDGNNGKALKDNEFHSNRTRDGEVESEGLNLTVKIPISDSLELTSMTAWDDALIRQPQFDWTASPTGFANGWADWLTTNEQLQQDFRLSYDYDRGTLLVGAYYGWDETIADNHNSFYEELPHDYLFAAGFPPVVAHNYYEQERKSYAAYIHGSYEFSDRLNLTVGVRYTKDNFAYNNAQAWLDYDIPFLVFDTMGAGGIGDGTFTMIPVSSHLNPAVSFWGAFSGQHVSVPTIPTGDFNTPALARYPNQSNSTSKPTGTIILDYQIADDIMAYGSISRGYRAGTMNGGGYLDPSQITFVEPEELDAFEVGIKSRFADNRVQMNVAAFFYNYTNQQVQNIIGVTSYLGNAAESEIKGIEVELAAMASDTLRLNLNVGFQDATYGELELLAGGVPVDLAGNRMMNSPKWNGSLSADWTLWQNGKGAIRFLPTIAYISHQYLSPFNKEAGNQKLEQDSYSLVTAQLLWETDRYKVRLWSRNLTDKTYMIYGIDIRSGFDVDYFVRGEPRSYGLDVSFDF